MRYSSGDKTLVYKTTKDVEIKADQIKEKYGISHIKYNTDRIYQYALTFISTQFLWFRFLFIFFSFLFSWNDDMLGDNTSYYKYHGLFYTLYILSQYLNLQWEISQIHYFIIHEWSDNFLILPSDEIVIHVKLQVTEFKSL